MIIFRRAGTLWQGRFEDMEGVWLRPCGPDRKLLPLPMELTEAERARADAERARADAERARADAACLRARRAEEELEALRAHLHERGGDD